MSGVCFNLIKSAPRLKCAQVIRIYSRHTVPLCHCRQSPVHSVPTVPSLPSGCRSKRRQTLWQLIQSFSFALPHSHGQHVAGVSMQDDSDLCPGLLSLLSALAFFLIKVQIYLLRWMTSNASRIGICLPLIHFLLHVPTSCRKCYWGSNSAAQIQTRTDSR